MAPIRRGSVQGAGADVSSRRQKLFRLPWRSRRQIREDVDEELRFHLDMRVESLVVAGMPPDAARARAVREFGDLDDARQYIGAVDRDIEAAQRRSDFMNDLWHDIGYSARKLRAAPLFTLAAIVTLALGVGANTAIFSVVNGVILQPLPFPHSDHLVRIRSRQGGHGDVGTPMDLLDVRTRAKTFVGVSVIEGTTANVVRDNADAERILGVRVSSNFFTLLRVAPVTGRFFTDADETAGAPGVVVISDQLWKRDYGGESSAVGKTVRINSEPFTVIGIAPAQHYPVTAELWMPKLWQPNELSDQSRGARWLGFLARVKDDVTLAAANSEVENISRAMEAQFPEPFRERRMYVSTVQDYLVGDVRKPLFIMLGAVSFVLLIACANVSNLLLVRATAREGEMAVRTALGAGRGRLVRQLITEAVMLSMLGALAGLGIAKLGMHELLSRAPADLPTIANASIDGTALVVTAAIALITGVLFGILPAMQVGREDLATTLRAGGRGARSRPGANRTKRAIVVAEVALAVTLLTGAGLLLHSFVKLLAVDPGFRPEGVLSLKVRLPDKSYDSTRARAFAHAVEERARALPGVKNVGLSTSIPMDNQGEDYSFAIRGRPAARPSDEPSTETRQVTPDFFNTMSIPLLRGRGITASDVPGAPKILVVSKSFADKFFPNENAIGQQIHLGWGKDPNNGMREIVGVVGDVHGDGLNVPPNPTVYAPIFEAASGNVSVLVRTSADPTTLVPGMRSIVRELDPELAVYSVQTMEERVATSIGRERFYATLIGVFAAVALILSAVGLYGVIAYAVSQRAHELGIRVALGATADRISLMVIREGLVLTALGVVIGVAGSVSAGKLLSTLLFGVGAVDPVTLGGVVLMLSGVAGLASWLPARRAARVDPLVAMRGD
jgi:putative ABC transport system permease protein